MGLTAALVFLIQAQGAQASLAGTVRDADTGAGVVGVEVRLTDLGRAALTDEGGAYLLLDVPAGPQHVALERIGYEGRVLHALVPASGTLRIDVALAPRPVPIPGLESRPLVPVRGVTADDPAFPEPVVTDAALRVHPLLAEPDAVRALAGGVAAMDPEAPSGVSVRGGAPDQVVFLLDGFPVMSPYHAAGLFTAWNPDALARVALDATAPSPAPPESLSGAVVASTRAPGERWTGRGGLSNTQARLTADGPLGSGLGVLVSLRAGLPRGVTPVAEASYVRGETGDALARLSGPLLGGRWLALGYASANELTTAAALSSAGAAVGELNDFRWRGRTAGLAWTRAVGAGDSLALRAWSASARTDADWGLTERARLRSDVAERGAAAAVVWSGGAGTTLAGARAGWTRSEYDVGRSGGTGPRLRGRTPAGAVFATHTRALSGAAGFVAGAALTAAEGRVWTSPRLELTWRPVQALSLSGGYARLHQLAQSLRNPESVVGAIFPADPLVGAGTGGVPVARGHQAVLGADWSVRPGARVGVQGFARSDRGLVLVAPAEGGPFATGLFATGTGSARGVAVDASVAGARYGLLASWAWQRARLTSESGRSWLPAAVGAAHALDAGLVVFPGATSSIRISASARAGRRGTAVRGPFEWEACNLLDRGCELAGSPTIERAALGGAALPLYLRVDLGARRHWHARVAGRDAGLALFGTVTNLFGRRNVLTYATDPDTGARTEIEMLPIAPLVVGVDLWF